MECKSTDLTFRIHHFLNFTMLNAQKKSFQLIQGKKLALVLDIDQTLIHSRELNELKDEDYFSKMDPNIIHLKESNIKLKIFCRPGLDEFIEKTRNRFNYYICTHGVSNKFKD